jgi:hypothetical protein
MAFRESQPAIFKEVAAVLQANTRSTVAQLQGFVHDLRRIYYNTMETPGGLQDQLLAEFLRNKLGRKMGEIRFGKEPADIAARRQVVMFVMHSGKRNGLFVEFAYVFTPQE